MNRVFLAEKSWLRCGCLCLMFGFISACSWIPHWGGGESRAAVPGFISLDDTAAVSSVLWTQYQGWRGVPYRTGGMSRGGLDCSGFVMLTYGQRFGIHLPRDTDAQIDAGREVSPKHLLPGDLVFFKTGLFKRHVGIYIGEQRFLHVSTSVGVTVSRLQDEYWADHFSKGVRMYP